MLVPITNTPRDYAWGSTSAIAELLGTQASGGHEAELWLGAHAGSPSRIVNPAITGGAQTLESWISTDPVGTLGSRAASARLPFLLKVLAADSPLSLQAHPTASQAAEGFARENAAGVPVDAPDRNYRDAFPKPELIYALSDTFDALCGFRAIDEARAIVNAFLDADLTRADPQPQPLEDLLESLDSDDAPRQTFEWLISSGPGVPTLVSLVTELAPAVVGWPLETGTVRRLAGEYPGDPGIVISLLLNRVRLRAGEALYLPAGNIHAYLQGLGIELMTASDNVLRGGLTSKHVDVPELLSVLDFRTVPVPWLRPTEPQPNVERFAPDGVGFRLDRVSGDATVSIDGPAILICTAGSFTVNGSELARGQSIYVTPDETQLSFAGSGTLFLATTN